MAISLLLQTHLQLIHNITRKFHDAIVKCEVHNAVGKSEESETLDISCKCPIELLTNWFAFLTNYPPKLDGDLV